MDFTEYMGVVNIVELKRGIKEDSTATLDFALDYYRKQANNAADLSDYDTRVEMVDRRITDEAKSLRQGRGNIYQIYSDKYVEKYGMPHWWSLKLDNFSLLELLELSTTDNNDSTMQVGDIFITTSDGVGYIKVSNPDGKEFNSFVNIDNNHTIRVEKETIDYETVKVSLIDISSFEEQPLDCSTTTIEVNYAIVFL